MFWPKNLPWLRRENSLLLWLGLPVKTILNFLSRFNLVLGATTLRSLFQVLRDRHVHNQLTGRAQFICPLVAPDFGGLAQTHWQVTQLDTTRRLCTTTRGYTVRTLPSFQGLCCWHSCDKLIWRAPYARLFCPLLGEARYFGGLAQTQLTQLGVSNRHYFTSESLSPGSQLLDLPPLTNGNLVGLPPGFEYKNRISRITAFYRGVDERDSNECVICGAKNEPGEIPLQRAHIIPRTEEKIWEGLKTIGIVPPFARTAALDMRNAITLCHDHHLGFDNYRFFIRWVPSIHRFVFVNFSREEKEEMYHGKIITLDPDHIYSPFPAPFLIQERMTRAKYSYLDDRPVKVF